MLELLDWFIHNNVVQGLMLVGILWVIAKDEANLELGNMCGLMFFSFALGWAAVIFLYPAIGIFGIVAKPIIFLLLIKYMCWVRYRIAFVATGLFVAVNLVLNTALVLAYFVQEAKESDTSGNLVTFAQNYVLDQFTEEEEWDEEAFIAEEAPLEEAPLAEVPLEEAAEEPVDLSGQTDEEHIEETQVAGMVPAPLPPAVYRKDYAQASENSTNQAESVADTDPAKDVGWIMSRRKIIVTGRFHSPKGEVAMVGNDMIMAGEKVKIEYKGKTYTWQLKKFRPHVIDWEPVL